MPFSGIWFYDNRPNLGCIKISAKFTHFAENRLRFRRHSVATPIGTG